MNFSLIKTANILTNVDQTQLDHYQTLSETLGVDIVSLIENDQQFSSSITDDDYKQWIIQVVMQLPRSRVSKNTFIDALMEVLENDPANKVNLGDEQLVDRVADLAWKKYQVVVAELNHKNYEEEEQLNNIAMGKTTLSPTGQSGEQGEPASNSPRGTAVYDDYYATRIDDSDLDRLNKDNSAIAELITRTKELIDSCKSNRCAPITTAQNNQNNQGVQSVEDEEQSKFTSKRKELVSKYDKANAEAQEAQRQARIKAAQAKQLDKQLSDLDKEIIKQGEHNYTK